MGFAEKAAGLLREFQSKKPTDPELTAAKYWTKVRKQLKPEAEELLRRFNDKCAFCESRPGHVSYPHIEHYKPKGRQKFENLMFEWTNWLPSCGRCNQSKWLHFPDCGGVPCLLDPSFDDPRSHLDFLAANIEGISIRGWRTIEYLDLSRSPLIRERASWLTKIESLLLLATLANQDDVKADARRLLIWAMQPVAPYSAMTLRHIQRKAPKLANPTTPHPIIEEADGTARIRKLVSQYATEITNLE